ncbi:TetR/AcrR family transcriptional regulator [Roseomonas genomospecies 6]|uniref:TetR/AcrR family transcriptional regulator n=1 Tax=Roseomonas genomospecies 6 TaxID=214106 RepID=A0A9W7NH57_9PROT|nr:TetR/AcrR family transcriptional regulator [Roseomonas genomospecies 6]KAA0678606.1 TetR/AcrR family transcriptional regulator [Roseomonas genomospecies 6]
MSTSKPRNYHHGDLRAALLLATEALLDEGGTGAVSLREVARRAGVSATACYRHYSSKEDLLAAAATRGYEELGAALRAAADGADNVLSAMAIAYVQFAVARPGRFRLMFGPAIGDRSRYPALTEAASRSFGELADAVSLTNSEGRGNRAAAIGAWSFVHGLSTLIIDEMVPGDDIPGLVRAILEARGTA